ncbi:MAG: U32 family peptidase, partial [Planctomycetes bacterium]|nr:U32 family peptidase [Planctomycetota bacterium]
MNHTTELLAPAGGPEAGYAALHFGADAVYLGLQRFSARAEADNFSPESLSEFAAYAHSLAPRRNVYLTLNTLITDAELAAAAETLAQAVTCGVDAVIVQDIGIAALARRWFPQLALHASTQMAIHNLPGVLAAADLGFRRVTLARELGLDEIAAIAAAVPIEIETFIHGTLCYSYSGLCMFSSLATGRSGNRGKCVYSCREAVAVPGAGKAHPFSLKDLALTDQALDLASAGVRSLKIEGRKKSPLYVAATVDYYRRLLDGTLCADDQGQVEARLKTIFARPWTKFFLTRRRNPDAADPDVVGHRGAPLGTIGQAAKTPAGYGVHFIPALAVERHDGIQIDIPGESKPYGFPVDSLFARQGNKLQSVFRIEAGQPAAVALPADAPPLSPGLSLYLSSSQEVKRSYPYAKPKPGAYRHRLAAVVEIALNSD